MYKMNKNLKTGMIIAIVMLSIIIIAYSLSLMNGMALGNEVIFFWKLGIIITSFYTLYQSIVFMMRGQEKERLMTMIIWLGIFTTFLPSFQILTSLDAQIGLFTALVFIHIGKPQREGFESKTYPQELKNAGIFIGINSAFSCIVFTLVSTAAVGLIFGELSSNQAFGLLLDVVMLYSLKVMYENYAAGRGDDTMLIVFSVIVGIFVTALLVPMVISSILIYKGNTGRMTSNGIQ